VLTLAVQTPFSGTFLFEGVLFAGGRGSISMSVWIAFSVDPPEGHTGLFAYTPSTALT
jgi:hypothetical protein